METFLFRRRDSCHPVQLDNIMINNSNYRVSWRDVEIWEIQLRVRSENLDTDVHLFECPVGKS